MTVRRCSPACPGIDPQHELRFSQEMAQIFGLHASSATALVTDGVRQALRRCIADTSRSAGASGVSPSGSIATWVQTARHRVATRSLCNR
jgi:hypothetical protein